MKAFKISSVLIFSLFIFFGKTYAGICEIKEDSSLVTTSRLLVCVDPHASFFPNELASLLSAKLVDIDPRNPYKALQKVFLNESLVVAPFIFQDQQSLRRVAPRYGYRYIVFKEETLEEAARQTQELLLSGPKYSSQLQQLSPDEANKIYSLMESIHMVFTSLNIKYWVGRETLLGVIRHGGLMPWDDYLYLYIMDTDEKKLQAAAKAFDDQDIELHSYFKDFYKVSPKNGDLLYSEDNPEDVLPFRYPAANIFVMTLEKKGDLAKDEVLDTYVHKSDNFYAHWHHDRFDYSQIETIFRANFGPVVICIPGDPESYLDRVYGTPGYPDLWKKYSSELNWDHRVERLPPHSGSALVEVDNFSPAPWH